MSTAGRPKVLDEGKQATICSLITAGVSLRQAANFVDCDPNSIRREVQRNDGFRRQLAKAKSEASIQPLETLKRAAKDDWRAALRWMERIDPVRFARPNASAITQREANRFIDDLVESIERLVSNDRERRDLFKLLSAAMPAAMRKRWNGYRSRRNIKRVKHASDLRRLKADQKERIERRARDERRCKLFSELAPHLPQKLRAKLNLNSDLLDPEEEFAQRPAASASPTSAAAELQKDAPGDGIPTDDSPTKSGLADNSLTKLGATNDGPTTVGPPTVGPTNNASPAEDFAPLTRRNRLNIASPPPTNPGPVNDLPPRSEAKSIE